MKILLVRRNWPHHSKNSGYDHAFSYLEGKEYKHVFLNYKKNYFNEGCHKVLQWIWPALRKGYRFDWFMKEVKVAWQILVYRPDVVHFNHFEVEQKLLQRKFFLRRTKYIGTCHFPYSFFKMGLYRTKDIRHAAVNILLDEYSSRKLSPELNTVYIPHAVDTDYFQPDPQKKGGVFKCFFTGRFIRDWDALFDVVRLSNLGGLPVEFHIIHPKIVYPHNDWYQMIGLLGYENVHYYERVSDEELKAMYQGCDVLLMPLFDSSANNVVLEAMACGLPVITNRTKGIESYISDDIAFLHPLKDSQGMVESIRRLLENPGEKARAGRLAREKAEKMYSIPAVLEQLKQLYHSVAQGENHLSK
jgi:glycosyltransferase involved in cell wall biosynthesis